MGCLLKVGDQVWNFLVTYGWVQWFFAAFIIISTIVTIVRGTRDVNRDQ